MVGWKAAGLAVALVAAAAQAECREDVEERLSVLADAFDDQSRATQIWSYSWGSIYAAASIAQGIALSTMNRDNPNRPDLIIGSISAAVGSMSFWLLPLRFTVPLARARQEWDDPDRCGLLARAEATRSRIDAEQKLSKSWPAHVVNVAVNVGLLLVLGFGYGHWEGGLISAGIGTVVGEVNLFSQPAHLGRVAEPTGGRVAPLAFTF